MTKKDDLGFDGLIEDLAQSQDKVKSRSLLFPIGIRKWLLILLPLALLAYGITLYYLCTAGYYSKEANLERFETQIKRDRSTLVKRLNADQSQVVWNSAHINTFMTYMSQRHIDVFEETQKLFEDGGVTYEDKKGNQFFGLKKVRPWYGLGFLVDYQFIIYPIEIVLEPTNSDLSWSIFLGGKTQNFQGQAGRSVTMGKQAYTHLNFYFKDLKPKGSYNKYVVKENSDYRYDVFLSANSNLENNVWTVPITILELPIEIIYPQEVAGLIDTDAKSSYGTNALMLSIGEHYWLDGEQLDRKYKFIQGELLNYYISYSESELSIFYSGDRYTDTAYIAGSDEEAIRLEFKMTDAQIKKFLKAKKDQE